MCDTVRFSVKAISMGLKWGIWITHISPLYEEKFHMACLHAVKNNFTFSKLLLKVIVIIKKSGDFSVDFFLRKSEVI